MRPLQKAQAEGCGCDAAETVRTLCCIDEALHLIARNARPVTGTERLAPADAVGRVVAEPVRSTGMVPPFDNAAMDGYALDSAALVGGGPWRLEVNGRVPAGKTPATRLAGQGAVRIFTGAPVPDGADCVVMQEEVERIRDTVILRRRPEPGLNIRRAGSDMSPGQTLLETGRRVGPREVAACAAAGIADICVYRRLRVALLVTGDEIRSAGGTRHGAQTWDINTPMLSSLLATPSVHLSEVCHGADNRDGLRRQLSALSTRADLVVSTGGISVGEEDHVKPALESLGAMIHFSGVAIKPGKPVSFGRIGQAAWLGLPGNPLSAFVTWQLFGAALVGRLTGRAGAGQRRRHVVTARAIRRKAGRCELRPATLSGFDAEGREVVRFDHAIHSGRVGGLPEADGLIFLPADADMLPEGALVEFLPFDET